MVVVYNALVLLHLLGMAGILAVVVNQALAQHEKGPTVLLACAITQVVTGVALVGIASAKLVPNEVNNVKIGVKLLIALAVLVLAVLYARKNRTPSRHMLGNVAALALINVGIAVFW
ncbi:hypothetical protein [Amycolatopsis suaedae]|uniref:Integral membrane protein n=1 Tax=Amycolatopsis suaedae TaxID=2510978 RepID=A0A4Q7J2M4_9PSEU|nr:hypothetical protein [Amycolatopsis suaedae]RZQ61700.1 hypothetical protein EWH70_22335 [Amycolatopsis suaedae]